MSAPSALKSREIVDALRIGAVPRRGLELFAVGMQPFESVIDEELEAVAAGRGRFKAARGEYGTGKTFFAHWLAHRAREKGFATAHVQISETETPLYRMETVYRRAVELLQTQQSSGGAFRALIDKWFYSLEEQVMAAGTSPSDPDAIAAAVGDLLEQRLARVSATQPQFAAALRRAHTARVKGEHAIEEGLIAWLMGQPNVGADIKRAAGIKGELDHFGAGGFLRGLLEMLSQTGSKGLVLVLDEVETIQRVRADSREKSLNALRHLIDEVHEGTYPRLYVLITGTPLFFDGPQGVRRAPALAMRLQTEFDDKGFDNLRAPQVRLRPFDLGRMLEVGQRVRAIYPSRDAERVVATVGDEVIRGLAERVTGKLGGKIGVAPRIFLKRLVDLLDRVDQYPQFDPVRDYDIEVRVDEMTDEERAAAGVARTVDDIELDVGEGGGSGVEG